MSEAAEGFGMNRFTHNVPVMIAVVLEKMNASARLGSLVKRKDYCMLDLGMAVEHFCLQAADLGLGTCIMGWFDEKRIARLLGVPRGKRIPLIIALGKPALSTRRKVRKTMEEMSSWNSY
jgi:nitroreductase